MEKTETTTRMSTKLTDEYAIIQHEQTPKVPEVKDTPAYILENKVSMENFLEAAKLSIKCVGLASNQLSKNGVRLDMRCFAKREFNDDGNLSDDWSLVINPVITKFIGMTEQKVEGCLSWLGMEIIAERTLAVEVSYYKIDGSKVESEIYSGFQSQVWQHEIDHLNGVEERIEDAGKYKEGTRKIGRNEACPCGSGDKYKKCCQKLKG